MRLALNFVFFIFKIHAGQFLVPYDHHLPDSRKIEIQVEFLNEFDAEKETVFFLEDAFDDIYLPFYELLDFSESSNFVLIKGRKDNEELKRGVMLSGSPDYQLAYKLYNQDQVARDIEVIRQELIGDEQVILLGYSSSAMVLQHYLSLYPNHVSRMISVNPLVFDIQKNLSFPSSGLSFSDLQLSGEQQVDFSYYANFDRENQSGNSLPKEHIIDFLTFQKVLTGLSTNQDIASNIPLMVRLFEHGIALSGFQDSEQKSNSSLEAMKKGSSPIWEAYHTSNFDFYGTNYDRLLEFEGKMTLIGAAFDQLIYPKSYDVLAEYYSNCTLLLLRDGHGLQQALGLPGFKELLNAFISNDTAGKISAYKIISDKNFIFEKYHEGAFKVPPLF
ncbi:alpha/beta hydrolase family protein [Algoriphagus ratkowskyi]|uniref:Alpha/beta hydrolase n=1 Tax=Algoriphagus ratkowskyi TaxID=57028 RepID=A0A2W7RIM9_9BACT|nr:alpha/beta fold hydrolase [Algoriphagus ratkowskyi]PZX60244.1 alpha/beta hydrolase family protein [Algoriphagus ratkowskyi]TXD78066.1 alpha/beta hydrolase [Algoriphagus ratkowskyi]